MTEMANTITLRPFNLENELKGTRTKDFKDIIKFIRSCGKIEGSLRDVEWCCDYAVLRVKDGC